MPGPALPAPRRTRRSDHARTRRRLLDAARRLMAERGPESLTVSSVAHAAELNRTTAYQHFRTRDELVRAVTDELIAEVSERVAAAQPIAAHFDSLAEYFLAHPELARLALHWLLTESPVPHEGWQLFRQETRQLAASAGARPGVDAEMLGHLLVAVAVIWPLHARIEYEDESAASAATARLTRELKRLLLYGLLRPEEWPDLVADVEREPVPAARRAKREA